MAALQSMLIQWMLLMSGLHSTTHQFTRSSTVCDYNPMKGFVTSPQWGIHTDFPISMEFYYIPLNAVMQDLDVFTWDTGLEPLLNATASRDRHCILRFFLDYPGQTTAVPQFLIDGGLEFNNYSENGGGLSPNYSDPNLKAALLNFIAALGANYDGDSRIAVIQLGLLGFWGEWHTYPHNSWTWSDSYGADIMTAFDDAFSTTQLNIRYPSSSSIQKRFGYHDDSFAYATVGTLSWFFYSRLVNENATSKWQENMHGGEIYPALQSSLFTEGYTVAQYSQKWQLCVNWTHSTYMINGFAFAWSGGYNTANGDYERGLEGMRMLGYDIYVDSVDVQVAGYNEVAMSVNVVNGGVAPFYYDLALMVKLCNEASGFCKEWNDASKNDLSRDVLKAESEYLVDGISVVFDDAELLDNFGDSVTGEFSAEFNVSLYLYSSMAFEGNPVRFCNAEMDEVDEVGSIRLSETVQLSGILPSYTDAPTSSLTGSPTKAPEMMTTDDEVDPTRDTSSGYPARSVLNAAVIVILYVFCL